VKAAIYAGKGGPVTIETIPEPEPGPTDLIVRVHRCGICGTDLSMTKGGMWDYGAGQFGHEYAGEIVAMGCGVEGFRIGENVSVLPSGACGHCAGCVGGNHILCSNAEGAMVGFSQYAKVPASIGIKLPSVLSMADGALVEPLAVSLYGVRMSRMQAGDRVLVLGGGTVALYAIYWARRLGAGKIVAMSRSDRRRDLCLAMGADEFIAFGDNEVGEVVEALGGAPDIVYECVGVEGMLMKAVMHAALYGKVVSLGFCTGPDPVMPSMASYKCVTMQFLVGYTMREFVFIADQMDKGHVDPKAILTNEIPLVELPAMIDVLRGPNEETKVHVMLA
jgi:threonine dehydrogenase-like Zn-dependent dehydrogenase